MRVKSDLHYLDRVSMHNEDLKYIFLLQVVAMNDTHLANYFAINIHQYKYEFSFPFFLFFLYHSEHNYIKFTQILA